MANQNYVQGLLDYIIDIKPFHSKLTEVIEEVVFLDKFSVIAVDHSFIRSKQSSIWNKTYTTDGYQRRFIIPPFFSPRYSAEINQYYLDGSNQNIYCLNTLNMSDAYQVRESRGIESVKSGNQSLAEGIDYYLSHGAYSFNVLPNGRWKQTNLNNITIRDDVLSLPDTFTESVINISQSGSMVYATAPIQLTDISLNLKNNIDSWKITCTDISHDEVFEVTSPSQIWNINHKFDNDNLVWEIFIKLPDGSFEEASAQVLVLDKNNLSVEFSQPYLGKIRIASVPEHMVFQVPTSYSSNKWIITHNLDTVNIITQIYVELETGIESYNYDLAPYDKEQRLIPVLAENLIILSSDAIEINFSDRVNGKVVIIPASDTFAQTIPANEWLIESPGIGNNSLVQIFTTDFGTYQQVIPQSIKIIDSNSIQILFSGPISGNLVVAPPLNQTWFNVVSQNKGFLGIVKSNFSFSNQDVSFSITSSNTKIGDFSEIKTQAGISISPNAIVDEIWSIIKINPIAIKSIKFVQVGLANIRARSLPTGITQEWTLACSGGTDTNIWFSVTGSISGPMADQHDILKIGISNFEIASQALITFNPGSRAILVGDSFSFVIGYDGGEFDTVGLNGGEYFEEITARINSNLPIPKLLPFTPSFVKAPGETWTLVFHKITNDFKVTGSVSGLRKNAKIGEEYDNGIIRFRIVNSLETIDVLQIQNPAYMSGYANRMILQGELVDDDQIIFEIYDKKPNYLVHGSVTGFTEPAVLGEYYWNGQVGFLLDLPKYRVYDHVNNQEIKSGDLSLYEGSRITFNNPPRFDASDERLDFTLHEASLANSKLINPSKQFLINSNTRGHLPAAVVGTRYLDHESVDNYPNISSTIDITIDSVVSIYDFSISIESNRYKPFHLQQVIILKDPVSNVLQINTFQEDKFIFRIDTPHLELGAIDDEFTFNYETNKFDTNLTRAVPTFLLASVSNTNYTLGFDAESFDVPEYDTHGVISNTDYIIGFDVYPFENPSYDLQQVIPDSDYTSGFGINSFDVPVYDTKEITTRPAALSPQYPVVPDRGEIFNLFLGDAKDYLVGTISWQFDTDAQFYRQVIDVEDNFALNYLQLNTNIDFEVQQADEYNHLVGALITDHLNVLERVKFKDLLNAKITDKYSFVIKQDNEETIIASITFGDKKIGFDSFGFDVFPYDFYQNNVALNLDIRNEEMGYGCFPFDLTPYDFYENDFRLGLYIAKEEGYDSLSLDLNPFDYTDGMDNGFSESKLKVLPNNNSVSTAITDKFNVVEKIKFIDEGMGYGSFPLDITPYDFFTGTNDYTNEQLKAFPDNNYLFASITDHLLITRKELFSDIVNANITFEDNKIGFESSPWDVLPYDFYRNNVVISLDIEDPEMGYGSFPLDATPFDFYVDNFDLDLYIPEESGYDSLSLDATPFDFSDGIDNGFSESILKTLPNNNLISTAINDFGLSIVLSYSGEDAGYDQVNYDVCGFGILPKSIDVLKQLEPIKSGPYLPTRYSYIEINQAADIITLEFPSPGLSLYVVTDINNILGSQLILNVDYGITVVETNKGNPTWIISMINIQPVIIFAFE